MLTKGSVLASAVGYSLRLALRGEMDSGCIAGFRSQDANSGDVAAEAAGGFRREEEVQGIGHMVHKFDVVASACVLTVSKKAANGHYLVEVVRRSKCIGNHIGDVALALAVAEPSHIQAGHSL